MRHLSDDARALSAVSCGLWMAEDGLLEDALDMFERAAAARPTDPRIHAHRATCLAKLERYQDSVAAFDRALVELARAEGELRHRRGNVLVRLGRHPEAQESLRRSLRLAPESADAWYDLGVSLQGTGQLDGAAAAFAHASAMDGETAGDAWLGLAAVHASAGRLTDAESALQQALSRRPEDVDTLFQLGLCRLELGRYEAALDAYDRALALDPQDADLWNNRGVALHELGRFADAHAAYARALALDGDLEEAARNLALLPSDTRLADSGDDARFTQNRSGSVAISSLGSAT
jgi:tetratricopeptide (TPR) repeat protein